MAIFRKKTGLLFAIDTTPDLGRYSMSRPEKLYRREIKFKKVPILSRPEKLYR